MCCAGPLVGILFPVKTRALRILYPMEARTFTNLMPRRGQCPFESYAPSWPGPLRILCPIEPCHMASITCLFLQCFSEFVAPLGPPLPSPKKLSLPKCRRHYTPNNGDLAVQTHPHGEVKGSTCIQHLHSAHEKIRFGSVRSLKLWWYGGHVALLA